MKGFDRLHVKSAIKSRKKFDLSQSHLTTMDFGQPMPLYIKAMVPGDMFNINAQYFARLAPLVKPTYGRFSFRTATYFVPLYQLADDADAFMMNMSSFEGSTPKLRYISYPDYVSFIASIGTPISVGSGEVDKEDGYIYDANDNRVKTYDFKYVNSSGTTVRVQYSTKISKFYIKVLTALGYSFPSEADLQTSSSWMGYYSSKNLNAMPILAFMKAFNDWMAPSLRYNQSNLTTELKSIRHNINTSYYNASTNRISANFLNTFLDLLKVCYESDYFMTAWQNPNNPINTSDTNTSYIAPAANIDGSAATILSNNSNVNTQVNYSSFSDLMLRWVQSVADYVRRNNYSGSRTPEKLLSRFGIKSEDFSSNYAHIISKDVIPINVGDVTATAQTNDNDPKLSVDLGDYAGKGILSGNGHTQYHAKDFGYIIVIGWITVNPMYPYGFDREVLSVVPNDFYQPEFDGIGPEAISAGEVFTNPIRPSSDTHKDYDVYGFTERYNRYRFGRDQLTGDFRNLHYDADMNVWHTARNLSTIRELGNMVAQSGAMIQMNNRSSEFDRIFSDSDTEYDHFLFSCYFNVDAQRPMLNLNQVPRLGEGDTNIARNGNEVN